MNGAGLGSKYLVEAGKTVQTVTCSFCGSSCSRHGSITPWPLSASPRCFEYHSRIWSRLADLKKTPPIPRMRPRCSVLTGGFDFSGCGDCTCCPPVEQTETSNSEPSAIVLHRIPCMRGLYIDSNGENKGEWGEPRAHEVSNWLSIAPYRTRLAGSQIACSSARGAYDSCKVTEHSISSRRICLKEDCRKRDRAKQCGPSARR